ncbi:MAG: hypothetical protein FWD01_00290 [Defluviitaleaceae bacterium]|nr:hypothetical protein [Defluviitaleaceae bacterium]
MYEIISGVLKFIEKSEKDFIDFAQTEKNALEKPNKEKEEEKNYENS